MFNSLGVRKFKSLLITSSAEMAIAVIVLMSDTIITGHIAGENGISRVNLITPLLQVYNAASAGKYSHKHNGIL